MTAACISMVSRLAQILGPESVDTAMLLTSSGSRFASRGPHAAAHTMIDNQTTLISITMPQPAAAFLPANKTPRTKEVGGAAKHHGPP
jgi:hypothetical protein